MKSKKQVNPPLGLALLFIFVILLGTIALKVPISTYHRISWLTAFFTTTSTITSTGLTVVDIPKTFTPFGLTIIAFLIQIGGVGIMTFATVIYLLIGKKLSIEQMMLIQEALNQNSFKGILKLARRLFFFSIFFEGFFGILLCIRFIPKLGWIKGICHGFFYAVSAFNNAGMTLTSDNLIGYAGDPVINVLISALFIIGGIGFVVINDIWDKKKWREFILHTKLMIISTVVINIIAIIIILSLEYGNPKTLGPLTHGEKFLAGYFQAVAPRSSGFNTVDTGDLRPATLFFIMILMFIGAGSISTGGGIKLSTFASLLVMITGYIRKKNEAVLMERTIHENQIFKAMTLSLLSIAIIFIAVFALLISETKLSFLQIAFETVSAFGTVGLSTGITSQLSSFGECVIALIMIFGKLGPLTLVLSLTGREKQKVRYPDGKIFIG
ncbi:TrkH family potassium uptake protein [Scopulibacillus cellulosilyticus]|uniref:TrkH family potassium uptake protein n=1 Tax=Scopulibacillus cellulosilyticus TaxID=2665665 RepID=A0ABW2PX73_9BACL